MKEIKYEVYIKRSMREYWIDRPYEVSLEIWEGGQRPIGVRGRGEILVGTYTLNRAKKKALKAILKHQKAINSGKPFGIVFQSEGTADDLTKALGK